MPLNDTITHNFRMKTKLFSCFRAASMCVFILECIHFYAKQIQYIIFLKSPT